NIYAQVALVMLIGILGKNAILIVEFAIQRRQEGLSVMQAAIEGSVARLRPILMTSFAFIAGLIPLVIASGAGALGNRSIGTAAAGGMLAGTLLGVVIIPGLYVVFASLAERGRNKRRKRLPGNDRRRRQAHHQASSLETVQYNPVRPPANRWAHPLIHASLTCGHRRYQS